MPYDETRSEFIAAYKRKLPHWIPEGATFFITFRLANSLPAHIIQKLEAEREHQKQFVRAKCSGAQQSEELYKLDKKYFGQFDTWLDKCVEESPHWLADERAAQIVTDEIDRLNGVRYSLVAYCIMPNHVHLVINTAEHTVEPAHTGVTQKYPLADILKLLKGRSARFCNQILSKSGPFWQAESYDHVIRNQKELENIIWYTLWNPVKAGLVEQWDDWKYTYLSE